MSKDVLQTVGLTKLYGHQRAVDSLSLHVEKGAVYGLIGRNGAGKTTFMKMIAGLAKPTEGEICLFGEDDCGQTRRQGRIGALIEAPGIYGDMTAFDNLRLKALALGVDRQDKLRELLALVGLSDTGHKKAGKFSLGMKQRLGIAMSLIGTPDLLILDEPINGLDPQGIIEIRNVIERLNKEYEMTILISSHILDELSRIATHYGMLDHGRLIRELSHQELMDECAECIEITSEQIKEVCVVLDEIGCSSYEVCDSRTVQITGELDRLGEINMAIAKRGIYLTSIACKQESLENFFVNVTGGDAT